MKTRLEICALFVLVLLIPGFASAKSYYYPKIIVDIYVNKDSTVKVEEHQTFNFEGEYSFAYRDLVYKDLDYISDIQVKDDTLRNYPELKIDSSSNSQKVTWYFAATDEERTFTLSYLMHGVITYQKGWDELYFNAIYADRSVEVEEAEVYLHLPQESDPEGLKAALYTTAENPSSGAQDNKTFYYKGRTLAPYTDFTIVAGWPKGMVEYHLNRTKIFQLIGIGLGILSIILVIILWLYKGKDAPGRGTIAPEFAPPDKKLPVALVGLLADEKVDTKEVVATLLTLAQRGYLHIREEKKEGFLGSNVYHLEKKKEFMGLDKIEKKIAEDIFGSSSKKSTKDLKDKFYKKLPALYNLIYNAGTRKKWFITNPFTIRGIYLAVSIIFSITFFIIGIILSSFYRGAGWIGGGLVVGMAALFIVSFFMSKKTRLGLIEFERWQGFKLFLTMTDRFGQGEIDEQVFEQYLPYAVVMRVEKEWANRFLALKIAPPGWYSSSDPNFARSFSTAYFVGSIFSFNSGTSSSFSGPSGGSGIGSGSGFGGGGGGGGAGGGGGGAG
ncbi:DUF2207 domain-containing protein [Patescibacteria group bacterium]|nr:DUF2207 domain-containing protein [Patescibacteria group bacterium]